MVLHDRGILNTINLEGYLQNLSGVTLRTIDDDGDGAVMVELLKHLATVKLNTRLSLVKPQEIGNILQVIGKPI